MVNKKGTRKAQTTKNRQSHQKAVEELNPQSSIEDHVSMDEKNHQILNSLNDLLIEETTEKREGVDLVAQAKDTLKTELDRSNAEKFELRNELDMANHKLIELNMEANTNAIAVENQLREMEDGVKRLRRKSSDRVSEIRVLEREANEIMSKANKRNTELETELEVQKKKIAELQEKLTEYEERLEKEKTENKSMVENIMNENNSKIEVLLSDKKRLEITKAYKKSEIFELKKTLMESNEIVRGLQDQVAKLQNNVEESMEKTELVKWQFDKLVKQKSVNESRNEMIMEEKQREVEELEKEKVYQMWINWELERKLHKSYADVRNSIKEERALRDFIGIASLEIEKVKTERNKLAAAYANLKTENDSVKKSLLDLKSATLDTPGSDVNGDKLLMPKNTAYEMEIESIKRVFKNREETIKETKNEVETMKQSLLQEEKKKKFWIIVLSVNSIIAVAASVAFARKTRRTIPR